MVDELVSNPGAAEAWRLARELAPEPGARSSELVRNWRWLAVAAGIVLTVGIGWRLSGPSRETTEPVYRGVEVKEHHVGAAAGSHAAARAASASMGRCAGCSISRSRADPGARGARGVGRIRRLGVPGE